MRKVIIQTLAVAAVVVSAASATAQDLRLEVLQRNIDIFSGVLEDALDFEEAKGLFGLSLGGIKSTYLLGQGVVLEVRTPLANSRNRLNLASLNSAMQTLQVRGNPFESIAQSRSQPRNSSQAQALSAQTSSVMALESRSVESAGFYAQMMERVANVDYSLAVNNAIQQATESARSLRSLGSLDDSDYEELRADIEGLRAEMGKKMQGLRELEAQIRESATQAVADSNIEEEIRLKLAAVMAQIEPLREQAVAKATELRLRSELAEQAYSAQWQQDVVLFEDKLYQAMCDYGSTLRELPVDERVSIILTGLGEQGEDQRRRDKIHVFNKADLQECQANDISAATLRERSDHYSY
ncbi:MAG: hypothetical protein JKY29_05385 [Gammaproteobacteria bacterium]|nr:hypothetical protein [Gammaproteobacteria bacterium]